MDKKKTMFFITASEKILLKDFLEYLRAREKINEVQETNVISFDKFIKMEEENVGNDN